MPAWEAARRSVSAHEDALAQQLAAEKAQQLLPKPTPYTVAKFALQKMIASEAAARQPSQPSTQLRAVASRILKFVVDHTGNLVPHHPAQRQRPEAPAPEQQQPMLPIEREARSAVDAMAPAPQPEEYYPYPAQYSSQPQSETQPQQFAPPSENNPPIYRALWRKIFQGGQGFVPDVERPQIPLPKSDHLSYVPETEPELSAGVAFAAQTANAEIEPTAGYAAQEPVAAVPEMEYQYLEATTEQAERAAFEPRVRSNYPTEHYPVESPMANLGIFIVGTQQGRAVAGLPE